MCYSDNEAVYAEMTALRTPGTNRGKRAPQAGEWVDVLPRRGAL